MAVKGPAIAAGQKRAFDSVFPSSLLKDLGPTPAATPVLGHAEFGQSFAGDFGASVVSDSPLEPSNSYPEQVIWDRAWHSATAFLSLPGQDFVGGRQQRDVDVFADHYNNPSRHSTESIRYVLSQQTPEGAREKNGQRESILEWYTDHIRQHFLAHSKPALLRQLRGKEPRKILHLIRDSLDLLHSIYSYPLVNCVLPQLPPFDAQLARTKFQRDLHALSTYALPQTRIAGLLDAFFCQCSRKILGVGNEEFEITSQLSASREEGSDTEMHLDVPPVTYRTYYSSCVSMTDLEEPGDLIVEPNEVKEARDDLLALMRAWSGLGLGGDRARKIFAAVLDKMLIEFVTWSYAGVDDDESGVLPHLHFWIDNIFARYAVQVVGALKCGEEQQIGGASEIHHSDVQNWQQMAITRLGALRVGELFDIVMDWDSTQSRIDDLKHYITNPSTRTYLTSKFIAVLYSRLLQPGVSTLHILRLYISIIRAFRRLDPKGVLLDRVARPIRRYLRDRDDTVRVIVTGLFSDGDDARSEPSPADTEVLDELATELQQHGIERASDEDGEIDWDNMEWVPDPIDAAADYRKSKSVDVIGSLMSLFEGKDAIVKELQTMLSDRLLQNQKNFNQEITVLELLKIRFGDSVLQSCSIMLRDITRESANINQAIRREQGIEEPKDEVDHKKHSEEHQPEFHAKILSHLFWPTLQAQAFRVPTQILAEQHLYEKAFTALKQSRKLTWLDALGQVEIELQLEDRCFKGEVTPWEASVIHAFESDDATSSSEAPVSLTVSELSTILEMSPLLVRSACQLWLSKSVLAETALDTYQVLERIPGGAGPEMTNTSDSRPATNTASISTSVSASASASTSVSVSASASAAVAAAAAASTAASESVLQQKMAVYHQFILSLLTNQGAMTLPRIVMMLGMVVPGGFPFSNYELKDFLAKMVRDGELEMAVGGAYRVVPQQQTQ